MLSTIDQTRLCQLLNDLAKRDEGGHLRAAYRCVQHAHDVLVSCGFEFELERRSLVAFSAAEKYILSDSGEEDCFNAAHISSDDFCNWHQATPGERAVISFTRAASALARAVSDYDFYEPDRENILMAIKHSQIAANFAVGGTYTGPEGEWQERFLSSHPFDPADGSRLRASLLAR